MRIKTRLVKEGSKKTLLLSCPGCQRVIERTVDKEILADNTTCNLCGCIFWWSIEDYDN